MAEWRSGFASSADIVESAAATQAAAPPPTGAGSVVALNVLFPPFPELHPPPTRARRAESSGRSFRPLPVSSGLKFAARTRADRLGARFALLRAWLPAKFKTGNSEASTMLCARHSKCRAMPSKLLGCFQWQATRGHVSSGILRTCPPMRSVTSAARPLHSFAAARGSRRLPAKSRFRHTRTTPNRAARAPRRARRMPCAIILCCCSLRGVHSAGSSGSTNTSPAVSLGNSVANARTISPPKECPTRM